MSNLSLAQQIVKILQKYPKERFHARALAEKIVNEYPEDFIEKRNNPRFSNESEFLAQIVAEIGARKENILRLNKNIFWQDKPRPRVYWFDPDGERSDANIEVVPEDDDIECEQNNFSVNTALSEHDLYPILVNYLSSELQLYCQRIDERRSRNSRGSGGNQWLHPDIVAMQPVDKEWNELIRSCVKQGAGQRVRLWSFEVKKELNSSNARKNFFQAVSNSSWANEGYLVATSISDSVTEKELRMLSALHGIGVIVLNIENPSESEMILPARSRPEVDWESTNRILIENDDFKNYIELVSTYYQTGRIRPHDWNRIT